MLVHEQYSGTSGPSSAFTWSLIFSLSRQHGLSCLETVPEAASAGHSAVYSTAGLKLESMCVGFDQTIIGI